MQILTDVYDYRVTMNIISEKRKRTRDNEEKKRVMKNSNTANIRKLFKPQTTSATISVMIKLTGKSRRL